jgi:hypothetical protein
MLDNRRAEQFMASTMLVASEKGWEMVCQFIASFFVAGNGMPETQEVFEELSAVYSRVHELLNDENKIWPELLPGGNQTNDMLQDIENYVLNGSFDHSAAYNKGWDDAKTEAEKIANERMTGVDRENLIPNKSDNIVLTYDVIVKPDGENSLFAHGCEFFLDEHGLQWIKFVPTNGHDRDKEHMLRTDSIYAVVRDTRPRNPGRETYETGPISG